MAKKWLFLIPIAFATLGITFEPGEVHSKKKGAEQWEPEISPMGAIARGDEPIPDLRELTRRAWLPGAVPPTTLGIQGNDRLTHSPTADDFQSETTIAKNGNAVVVGYNDVRGFGIAPISVSGYAYSSNGGVTWTDGGQLPTAGGDAVYGDPDINTWTGGGQDYFFYSSLYVTPGGDRSLCLHVSTDGGMTWMGPREVTTATSPSDFPDKEYMDVDPETGRIFISWTNFGGSTTMRVTYSDDFGISWNGPTSFASSVGQGSAPAADGQSDNTYIVWRTSSTIQLVRSTDNGVTWVGPNTIAGGLSQPMNPYGSDRIHGFPAIDVDDANGNVYVTYASRDLAPDFSDIYFMSSTDTGLTWSAPVAINSNPGSDRAQFFPWLSVDQSTGRIDVVWLDQIFGDVYAEHTDITDLFHTHSSDGGATWSCPTPLTDDRFHAEYGNTTSQPNIGDYNQCVSDNGMLYVSFAKTDAPSHLTYAPDTYVDVSSAGADDAPVAFLDESWVDYGPCNGSNSVIEPGDHVDLDVEIWNYATCVGSITDIVGTLSALTPGVIVLDPVQAYPDLAGAGSSSLPVSPFQLQMTAGLSCGSDIQFYLDISSSAGNQSIPFSIGTGAPFATTLLSEDFEGVTPPALPAGWSTTNVVGTDNPWETSVTHALGANSVFCADVSSTSLNRLASPSIAVPANCDILRVELWVTHDIEDDFERKAWDGALLRIRINGGQIELASAFASEFSPFYPWQMNRQSSSSQPLQDLSCWSSDITPNFEVYKFGLPGLGGSSVELLFDMGTDGFVGTSTGMFVDNIRVESVDLDCNCGFPTAIDPGVPGSPFDIVSIAPNPFNPSTTVRFTLPERMAVTAEVLSVDGGHVRLLAEERPFAPGENRLEWDGRNNGGSPVASGVYFIRVKTPVGTRIARAVLLK